MYRNTTHTVRRIVSILRFQ